MGPGERQNRRFALQSGTNPREEAGVRSPNSNLPPIPLQQYDETLLCDGA
jgi:hypothetical protein